MKMYFLGGFLMFTVGFSTQFGYAQTTETTDDSTATDTTNPQKEKIKTLEVPTNGETGSVELTTDERVKTMTTYMGTPVGDKTTVQLAGYRVQLYFANDKDQVNARRADFMDSFNDIPVYVDYLAPNFRLRCGNFRTRLQAQALENAVRANFPDAIVVEEWIELPELKR